MNDEQHLTSPSRDRRTASRSGIAVLDVVPVEPLGAWTVRIIVPHGERLVAGWSPVVFWSRDAGEAWLDGRASRQVRPTVSDCGHGAGDLVYATVVDADGNDVLVSEPMPRTKAAGVAALFAAEFRTLRA